MSDYLRSFNRYEFKYLMTRELMGQVIRSLQGYVYADSHGGNDFGYPIVSVYCDSPGLSLFWEKIEGVKFRRKVRFRRYGNDDGVYLEIKQRIDRTVQKRRIRWPLASAADALQSIRLLETCEEPIRDHVTSETLFLCGYYGLEPCMAVRYRRKAFFSMFEPDQRITFDTDIRYNASDLDIRRPFEAGKYLVDPNCAVMEIKFNDRVPLWLCKVISRYGLTMIRLSKYCTAIDREYFQGHLT